VNTLIKPPPSRKTHQIAPAPSSPRLLQAVPPLVRPRLAASHEPTSEFVEELADELFVSLPRSDQRRKGLEYLRGLLATPGRKSIRSMATQIGGNGTGQSLHHFICSSTWDWGPVRRALAEYLTRTAPPVAWVVRPLVIPKVGQHSVGVSRYFSSAEGQVINAQRAVGVWLANDRGSAPVEWSLHLPGQRDGAPDGGAAAPEPTAPAALEHRAVDACLRLREGWGLPPQPVVLDLDETEPVRALRRLRQTGLRPMARVSENLPLTVTDPALIGHSGRTLTSSRIIRAARELRRPMGTPPQAPHRSLLVASVQVELAPGSAPDSTREAVRDLALVGLGHGGPDWPGELWLVTNTSDQAAAAVLRASALVRRVDRSLSEVGGRVGMRDYTGRSFNGWHRHITLASAAHAVSELSGRDRRSEQVLNTGVPAGPDPNGRTRPTRT
jgi:hypothetical protein